MNLKRHHVLYGLLAVSLMVALVFFLTPNTPDVSFIATSTPIQADPGFPNMRFEVVTTDAEHSMGLSGRANIQEDYGMLFVFEGKARRGFWMKDMLTSIDIIWLSDNGTILGIEDNISPSTYPKAFYPPEPVKYVLETAAGESSRRGWKIGTHIPLPLPYGS